MAQFSYNRKYELIVGQPFREIPFSPSAEQNQNTFGTGLDLINDYKGEILGLNDQISTIFKPIDLRTVDKVRETVITDLHIEAHMSGSNETKGSKGQTSYVKIFNMSENTRNSVARVGNRVILKAGYESDIEQGEGLSSLPIILMGTVDDVEVVKQGEDIITTLHIKDGTKSKTNVRGVIRVSKGRTYKEVFEACAELLRKDGISIGELILDNSDYPQWYTPLQITPADVVLRYKGYSFSGKVSKCLDDLCAMFGYRWDIVNETLFIHPASFKDWQKEFTLTSDNIISMQKQESSVTTTTKSATSSGYAVRILLDGRVDKKSKIVVEGVTTSDGESVDGVYRITSLAHTFTYEGQECYTDMEISR